MAGLLDYIEAPFQAIGGLFGAGQPASPQGAPAQAPLAASSAWTPIPQMPVHSTVANFVDNLFGSPQREHDQQAYNQALLQWQNQNLAQGFPDLPPEVQSALRVGGPSAIQEYVKNRLANTTLKDGETAILGGDRDHPFYAPATMSGGQSRQFGGPGGQMDTAPMLGVTPSGFAYTQTPTGTGRTGFLPPYQSNPVTNNSGFVAPPPGVPIAPAVDGRVHLGGGGTAQPPQIGAQPMPGAPPQGAAGTGAPPLADPAAPRGIRNNNPGNVRALPNGQMWAGQTGTDEQGYAIFADPKAGVHATLTNLDAYANRHGISTPQAIAARWSPNAPGYGPFIAQQLGVKPGDRINLKDPAVQGQVAQAIFKMENGPQAMQARFPSAQPQAQGAPAQGAGQAQPASTPPGYLPSSVQGQKAVQMTPQEATAAGYAPGAVVIKNPDGSRNVQQEGFTPQVLDSIQGGVAKSKQYDEYTQGNDAYKAMISAANLRPGGMRAYALRDTFARVINPGAVARVGTIQAIKEAQGVPAAIQGYFSNLKGDGDVPPQIAQQILDVAQGFAKSHYDSAKALNDANASIYTPLGVDPRRVTAPMDDEPARYVLGAGPVLDPARAAKLKPGQSFVGLDGKKRTRK